MDERRLLIVEDDLKLARALRAGFSDEGYAVEVAMTGDEALAHAAARVYDAVVLDVMLPGPDGFTVCRTLHERDPDVPVLILTARGAVDERIRGLDAGADDYLVKPFDFGELVARVRATIRRSDRGQPLVLAVGDLRVDVAARVARRGNGAAVELTARELALLDRLVRSAGEVVPREELVEAVWGDDPPGSPNLLDVYIGYLRRKLERPLGSPLIRTVRGVGFMLDAR
jgi:two-component system, OmpR family, response regulator